MNTLVLHIVIINTLICQNAGFNYSNWNVLNMPEEDYNIAVGYFNGTIHLIGGQKRERQRFLFNIYNKSFELLEPAGKSVGHSAGNNYYTQIQHIMYLIDETIPNLIYVYNLKQKQFTNKSIIMNLNATAKACITASSMQQLLFISGGENGFGNTSHSAALQILNISNNSWLRNVPSLQSARKQHSCVFNEIQKTLWIIGGFGPQEEHSVEVLSMYNMTQFVYSVPLVVNTGYTTVCFRHMMNAIFVLGGYMSSSVDEVQIINCSTGTVSIAGYLKYQTRRAAGILANEILYVFGGRNSDKQYINTYQYLDLNEREIYTTQSVISTTDNPTITQSFDANDTYTCSNGGTAFMNTTYDISVNTQTCIDGVIDFISMLLMVIDFIYHDNNLFVHSNISTKQREQLLFIDDIPFCGDIRVHILTCFNNSVNAHLLENITNSQIFEQNLNDNIDLTGLNDTVIWIYIQNTTIIYVNDHVPEIKDDKHKDSIIWMLIIISVCTVMVLIFVIIFCKKKQKRDRYKKAIFIQNAMCIFICICDYDNEAVDPDTELQTSVLSDLPIEKDIENLHFLFGPQNLQYSIYPYCDDITNPKTNWTRNEILRLLEDKAMEFDKSDEFDALILVFSGHGINSNICTSDKKLISKLAVHRMFSKNYFHARKKPRIIIFDSCEGNEDHGGFADVDWNKSVTKPAELGKNFEEKDIEQKHDATWAYNTDNPDFRLVEINAANAGFQSKLDTRFGSYMIKQFVDMTCEDLNANKLHTQKYLGEILDDVQHKLHSQQKKQLIVAVYNNGTRNIIFKKNTKVNTFDKTATEMIQLEDVSIDKKQNEVNTENNDAVLSIDGVIKETGLVQNDELITK